MSDTNTELIQTVLQAIKGDDADSLASIIENGGVNKNICFPPELDDEPPILRNGAPFICMAAYFGSIKCIKFLLSQGWDADSCDDDGMSASYYAAAAGKVDVIRFLKENNISISGCGQASLTQGNLEAFKQLLNLKIVSINDTDFLGNTYLHIAAFNTNTEAVRFLLSFPEVNINEKDHEVIFLFFWKLMELTILFIYRTPLHLAAGNGSYEICKILLENKNIDSLIPDRFALHYAAVQEEYEIVKLFLGGDLNAFQAKDGKTPLMRAIIEGKQALAKLIIDLDGIDVNIQDSDGNAAIHFAIMKRQKLITSFLLNHHGINPNIQNKEGVYFNFHSTPLHIASAKNLMDIVQLLLEAEGININIKDINGVLNFFLSSNRTPKDVVEEKLQQPPKPPKD